MTGGHTVTKLPEMNDYRSELPEDILWTITSMLGIKDAAKTSILSKFWRYIWVNHPDLKLNQFDLLGPKYQPKYHQLRDNWEVLNTLFVKYVDQIMQQRIKGSTTIKCFSLECFLGKKFSPYIDRWIRHAIRNGLETLDLDCHTIRNGLETLDLDLSIWYITQTYTRYEFSLLRTVYENKGSLKHIRLVYCNFECQSSLKKFDSLVSLNLKQVNISNLEMMNVLESCPRLEKLTLYDCGTLTKLSIDGGNNNRLKILSLYLVKLSSSELMEFLKCCPLLEELSLEDCYLLTTLKICDSINTHMKRLTLIRCFNLNDIDICVSNLQTLEYINKTVLLSLKIKAPKLVEAFIFESKHSQFPMTRLCLDIPMLENLVLLMIDSSLFFKFQDDPSPQFCNVRQLFLLDFSLSKSSLLYHILKCFPSLQTLGLNTRDDLKKCVNRTNSEGSDWDAEDNIELKNLYYEEILVNSFRDEKIKIEVPAQCPNGTITKLELNSFNGSQRQIALLEYLLENLTGLKVLAIGSSQTRTKSFSKPVHSEVKILLRQIIPLWVRLEIL